MEYEVALQQLLTVYALQKKSGDNKIHITTDLLAAIYLTTSKHKKALEFAIASIDYSRKTGDSLFIVNYYLRLGAIYFEMHNPEKAYYYFNKALSVMVHSKKNRAMAVSLLGGIVNCLIEQNKTKEAYDFFSRELKKYPAVDAYSTQQVNMSYLNLQYNLKQYKEAEKTLIKAIKPDTSYSFMLYDRMYVFTIGAGVYLQLKQYDKAGWYADSAYTMAKEVNSKSNLKDITFTLYKLELAKGNYPAALGYYENYKNYSDSIQQEIFDKRTIELGVKYETDQKNSQLQFLSIEATLHKNALKQGKVLRNFMIAASLLLLLLLLLIFNRYRVKQRANKLLQEKQDEINLQNQQLEKMVHEEKKITAEKDKLLQEKEWLMKEINHRVKNNLQVVMSLLNTQSAYLKDEAALNAIQESQHRVHAISLIHRKLYQSDRQLTTIDMAAYIKEVTDYLADSLDPQNRIRFGLFIEPIQLDVAQAVPTGLIINEAVTNAVKYAFSGGRTAQININMFKKANGMLELAIQDNGTGLPPGFNWRQTDSLGMNLMQGLCKQLDGEFDVLQQDGLTIKISFEPAKVLNQ
nr:histidine kinase dimerization/phosphoacceptor domain -containing protein [Longitalea arenae]